MCNKTHKKTQNAEAGKNIRGPTVEITVSALCLPEGFNMDEHAMYLHGGRGGIKNKMLSKGWGYKIQFLMAFW